LNVGIFQEGHNGKLTLKQLQQPKKSYAALAGGALALGKQCNRKIEQKPVSLASPLKTNAEGAKFVTEPQHQI
jgi:hypothetical protein